MSVNQRQHERHEITLKVLYPTITNFLDDYTANISIGGCFLISRLPFKEGEDIDLTMVLPTGQSIDASGIVRWVSNDPSHPGVGVQFTVLSEKDRAMIEELVSSHSSD